MSSTGAGSESVPPVEGDFRWQAFFQKAREPLFLLDRRRRILFVNRAWEALTGLGLPEVRGLVCRRRLAQPGDPWDLTIRSLCAPPREAVRGEHGKTRRLVHPRAGGAQWWDIDFRPWHDDQGLLGVLGQITVAVKSEPASPFNLPERLAALRASHVERFSLARLTGHRPDFARLREQVRLAAETRSPALILGEVGTGKDWIARTIHQCGPKRAGSFLPIACGRLPPSVLGALLAELPKRKDVRTVYLEEPARLPRDLQVDLVQRFQDRESEPSQLLAGEIADPERAVQEGRLHESLYWLLSPLVLRLPPLRDRFDDLPQLVEEVLGRLRPELSQAVSRLSVDSWSILRAYRWPGNLDELFAVVRGACHRATSDTLEPAQFPAKLRLLARLGETSSIASAKKLALDDLLEKAERRLLILAMRKAKGNQSQAAESLSIWRARLARRLEALGIDAKSLEEK